MYIRHIINSGNSKIKALLLCIILLSVCLGNARAQNLNDDAPEKKAASAIRDPQVAFVAIKKKLTTALSKNDQLSAAQCYQQIGELFYYQTGYSQALDNYYKADKIFRTFNDRLKLADNLNNIGQTYYHARQYTAATKVFMESLKLYRAMNNRNGVAEAYGAIGQTFEKTNAYAKAVNYQQLALREYKLAGNNNEIAKIYENLGSLHEDKLQLDSALKYFRLAEQINSQNNNMLAQIEVINNLGDVYRKSGKYRQSLPYTFKAARLAEKYNDQYQLGSAYRDLSKAYNLLNRNDSAYFYSEAGRTIFLKIYTEENEKQLAILQTLFEIEQKDNAIDRFESEKTTNRIIAIGATVIMCLVALLAASVISRQRLKIKNEQRLNEQSQQSFKSALELKTKELTTHTLNIIQKNQLLDELKEKLNTMVKDDKRDQRRELKKLMNMIQISSSHDKNWEDFRVVFEQVHENFFDRLKQHPAGLNAADMRLLALLKMNLGSADIATMLGISQDSLRIARYRLRKKLNLDEGERLQDFIKGLG
ncbi:tetratricopeptide repeat protein [Mucilaginibacter sp. JRF]|uniref:tetratricopeptide repeat protein n=1 Tax=Mucilaginibacter sp. JRF TaxID=2780088 RepID=UPI0018801095|nr:tetratricopeptide repeat protein [Mucilaginibacter sp. JRF]MBE9585797.1 tetratricopeptide repeat protein [Mucilaginibacter sp. JRF]